MDPIRRDLWEKLPELTSMAAEETKSLVEEALRRGEPVFVVEADGTRTKIVKVTWRQAAPPPADN